MPARPIRPAALLLVALLTSSAWSAPAWHHPLYRSGGGWWRQRIHVGVSNGTKEPLAGRPLELVVGRGPGQADVAETPAEAIRVCGAQGVEMLFGLTDPAGKPLRRGPVPEGSRLLLPIECPPQGTADYYVYSDNPAAGEVPDFWSSKEKPTSVASEANDPAHASVDMAPQGATPDGIRVSIDPPERVGLKEVDDEDAWYDDNAADDLRWDCRAEVRVFRFPGSGSATMAVVDLAPIRARLARTVNLDSIRVVSSGKLLRYYRLENRVIFEPELPEASTRICHLYLSTDPRVKPSADSDEAAILASPHNRLKNPSFEQGGTLPEDWRAVGEVGKPVEVGRVETPAPGLGRHAVRLRVPPEAPKGWRGWLQQVPARPGATYLLAGWLKSQDLRAGARNEHPQGQDPRGRATIHVHLLDAKGALRGDDGMTSVGDAIEGTTGWTLLAGLVRTPPSAATLQVHLTMDAFGTLWHDGLFLAEVSPVEVIAVQRRSRGSASDPAIWPVNAIVKVFREDVPPESIAPARIALARNEQEPLQLAVRSGRAAKGVRVEVDRPVGPGGATLPAVDLAVVGYVPIDYPTAYYHSTSPAWHRKTPTAAPRSDGWAGWWPDPLLPQDHFDLEAGRTQPVWITFTVGKDTPPGEYRGRARLVAEGKPLAEIPLEVRVWDFALPDESHVKAIYDVRHSPIWGEDPELARKQILRFMAQRRLCPDKILPDPELDYRDGRVVADFTKFDEAAAYTFDELKLPHSYAPYPFYLFGWGHPPSQRFGQQPYPGKPPFEGADRARLDPEYKRRVQACLKVYWDHVKTKGWDKRIVLYLCDEPFFAQEGIRRQMKALCEMIHEVDPAIPIYASTWHHVPDWDGSLDVWGIGPHGIVSREQMRKIRDLGARFWFTTDGHMCIDTPYCAVERLLPHYCFEYGAEAYEFWGANWLTYDPYRFGWHAYISQSEEPGKSYWIRYPNGDGYLLYPGGPIGHDGPVSSIRLEQAREGVEDYEYLLLLREAVEAAKARRAQGVKTGATAGSSSSVEDTVGQANRGTPADARTPGANVAEAEDKEAIDAAEAVLRRASELVKIPNAGGLRSTELLPNPDAVLELRQAAAEAIERLAR